MVEVVVRTMSPTAMVGRQTGWTVPSLESGQLVPPVRTVVLSGTANTSHFSCLVVSCCFLIWAVRLSFLDRNKTLE